MKDIFIVRHGQSEANANVRGLLKGEEYLIDCKFGLTELGKKQAFEAGLKISKYIPRGLCNIYISPYERTRQTADEILKALASEGHFMFKRIEDPRLVEQDFGDFDFQYRDKWKEISPHSYEINQARYNDHLGRFFARLENGENLLDVYNRVSLFVATRLEREMKQTNIIVTHGNTERILLMYLFNIKVDTFKDMKLYGNASVIHVQYDEEEQKYKYVGEI